MCKVNKHNRIKTILENIVKIDSSLEEECEDFLIRVKENAKIDSTFPTYQQVIYKIYGPNYPANKIKTQEIKSLINSVSNNTIKDLLYEILKEKESSDDEKLEVEADTIRNAAEARLIANNELINNLNSINNIK